VYTGPLKGGVDSEISTGNGEAGISPLTIFTVGN
jgi:hypothetical protein